MVGRAYQSTEGLVKPVKAMVKGVSGFADVKGVKRGGNRKTRARDYPGLGYGLMPKTKEDAARDFDGLVDIVVAAFCVLGGMFICCAVASFL